MKYELLNATTWLFSAIPFRCCYALTRHIEVANAKFTILYVPISVVFWLTVTRERCEKMTKKNLSLCHDKQMEKNKRIKMWTRTMATAVRFYNCFRHTHTLSGHLFTVYSLTPFWKQTCAQETINRQRKYSFSSKYEISRCWCLIFMSNQMQCTSGLERRIFVENFCFWFTLLFFVLRLLLVLLLLFYFKKMQFTRTKYWIEECCSRGTHQATADYARILRNWSWRS